MQLKQIKAFFEPVLHLYLIDWYSSVSEGGVQISFLRVKGQKSMWVAHNDAAACVEYLGKWKIDFGGFCWRNLNLTVFL